jgi:hypothetical protein
VLRDRKAYEFALTAHAGSDASGMREMIEVGQVAQSVVIRAHARSVRHRVAGTGRDHFCPRFSMSSTKKISAEYRVDVPIDS